MYYVYDVDVQLHINEIYCIVVYLSFIQLSIFPCFIEFGQDLSMDS